MEKESVKKFDLEAAFKALDEIAIPETKGIKANRVDLKERFSHKPATETLVEDYYDVANVEDLEEAQEEREGEVAQAKLARIEKIVDLDAESPDELLPSYVGKVIMQCPQCMTLFYKNPEDIEHSEENPDVVNINEVCQHCGNTSGYTLIGKVGAVEESEVDNYEELPAEENELDLDFDTEEPTEETPVEEESGEEELDLNLDLEEVPEEETNESLNKSEAAVSEEESEHKSENLTLNEETTDESLNKSEEAVSEHESENASENLTLNEEVVTEEVDKDLDKKLKAHNDYIEYLKKMIEQEEAALKACDNDEIKAAIQRRIDAFNADLEAALPDALKDLRDQSEEIPEVVEAGEVVEEPEEEVQEEPVEEALVEETTENCKVVLGDEPEKEVFAGTKEECEQIVSQNQETETAKEHGLEILEPGTDVEESLNKSEEAPSEHASENESENLTLNESLTEGAEAEIDAIIASWGDVSEGLTEEGDLDKLLDSDEFKTPVSEEEIDNIKAEVKEENLEECNKQPLTEEPEDSAKAIVDGWKEDEPVEEDINITNNDSPSRVDNRQMGNHEEGKEAPVEEGIVGAIGDVVGGVVDGVKNLLASDEAEKKDLEEGKTEEGLGLLGVGDVNINLDASGQNNAVGVGGGEGKTEGLLPDGLPGLPGLPGLTEEAEEETPAEDDKEEESEVELTPIETTVEEVKEVAQEVAEEVLDKAEAEVEPEVVEETVNEVVEDKLGEETSEEETEEANADEEELADKVEDLDEASFNQHVSDFLTEVYENVKCYEATDCKFVDNKLIVEGKILFNSGKERLTMFEFLPNYGEGSLFLEGTNKEFSVEPAFRLNCSLNEKVLITEGLNYSFKINEVLVEGLK